MACRMTRRGRVTRSPREATACWSLAVVSAVLRRSPVETRCDALMAIRRQSNRLALRVKTSGKWRERAPLRMNREQAHDVVVHDVGEQDQEKDEADLDEALFERQAEIAAANAFHGEQQNVSAIENRNRQQVEDAQIQAKHRHQVDGVNGALLDRLARLHRDSHNALQLPD